MLPSVRICGFETMAPALTAEATNQTADTFANSTFTTTRSISANACKTSLRDESDCHVVPHHCLNGHLSNSLSNSLNTVNNTSSDCGSRPVSAKTGIVRFRFSLKDTNLSDSLNTLNNSLRRETRFISLTNLSSPALQCKTNSLISEDINMNKGLSNGHDISLTSTVNTDTVNDNATQVSSPTISSSITSATMGLLNSNNKDNNLTQLLLKSGKPENGQRIDFTNIPWSELKQNMLTDTNVGDTSAANSAKEENANSNPVSLNLPKMSEDCDKTERTEEKTTLTNETELNSAKSEVTAESDEQKAFTLLLKSDVNCEQSLKKQTERLMRRIRYLQFKQTHRHLTKQMKAFVAYEQNITGIACQRQLIQKTSDNINLISHIQSVSNPVEDRLKMLTPEGVKGLSTSALVNLVKRLGNSSAGIGDSNHSNRFHDFCLQPQTVMQTPVPSISQTPQSRSNSVAPTDCEAKLFQKCSSQLPSISSDTKESFMNTIESLNANLRHFEYVFDSDATESSSGGESCDEFEDYNQNDSIRQQPTNKTGNFIPIKKRSCWKWCVERGAIGSRWTWLQAQVADLEFKIRQQNEMYRQLRATKGVISFGAGDNNFTVSSVIASNITPKVNTSNTGTTNTSISTHSCANMNNSNTQQSNVNSGSDSHCMRTLPLNSMRKRKLVRSMNALSGATRKAAKYSTVQCACNGLPDIISPCVLCNGRYSYVHVIDTDCMPHFERVALLDSSCHSVLSLSNDVSLGLHFSELLKRETIQRPISRQQNKKRKGPSSPTQGNKFVYDSKSKSPKRSQAVISSSKLRKKYDASSKRKYTRRSSGGDGVWRKRGRPRERTSSGSSRTDSPIPSPAPSDNSSCGNLNSAPLHRRRRSEQHAFDINNIVIPYSIAATTRVEKLQYKEIITPKWRINEPLDERFVFSDQSIKCEDSTKCSGDGNEDISDLSFSLRHLKCEEEERKRILSFMKGGSAGGGHLRQRAVRVRFDSGRSDNMTNVTTITNSCSGDGLNQAVDSTSQDYISSTSSVVQNSNANNISLSATIGESPTAMIGERRRTVSLSSKREDSIDDECGECVTPFELRTFPLSDNELETLTKEAPTYVCEDNSELCADPEKSNEGTITANNSRAPSPIMSDAAESVVDNVDDFDNEDEDPEWEPKKLN